MVRVDCKGLPCPQPLIETRKAMRANEEGTEIEVCVDNATASRNVEGMLADYGVAIVFETKGDLYVGRFINPKIEENMLEAMKAEYLESCTKKNNSTFFERPTILCISNVFGVGDDTLGALLMKGFLSTIVEEWGRLLPREILFLNSGVKLCLKDSGAIDTLRNLESRGTELLICGTCVDFYKIRELLAVGSITNMQKISSRIASANKLIRL